MWAKITISIFFLLGCFSWGGLLQAQDEAACVLTAVQANVRQSPSLNGAILEVIRTGDSRIVTARTEDSAWYQLDSGGWVAASVALVTGEACQSLPVAGADDAPADSPAACTLSIGTVSANAYQSPDTNAALVGVIPAGTTGLTVLSSTSQRNWYEVRLASGNGWVEATRVQLGTQPACLNLPSPDSAPPAPDDAPTPCTLTAVRANVREQPMLNGAILDSIVSGESVEVVGISADGSWRQIATGGWVAASVSSVSGDSCATLPITDGSVGSEAPVEASPTAAPQESTCPPDFAGYHPPRLALDSMGIVSANIILSRVQREPANSANLLFEMTSGSSFTVVAGPQCAEGSVWWEVEYEGQRGWVAESNIEDTLEYYLDPLAEDSPAATPITLTAAEPSLANYIPSQIAEGTEERISGLNVTQLALLAQAEVELRLGAQVAWEGSGGQLALLQEGEVLVLAYPSLEANSALNEVLAALVAEGAAPRSMAFSPDGRYLALGHSDGSLVLIELSANITAQIRNDQHQTAIEQLAFSPEGDLLLSVGSSPDAGGDFSARLWNVAGLNLEEETLPLLASIPLADSSITDAAFTADGMPVLLSAENIFIYNRQGVQSSGKTRLSGTAPTIEAANPLWLETNTGVVYAAASTVQGLDVSVGVQESTLVDASPAAILDFRQTPSTGDLDVPLIATYVDYGEAEGGARLEFVSPATNDALFLLPLQLLDFRFSPDGRYLAALTPQGLEIYGIVVGE